MGKAEDSRQSDTWVYVFGKQMLNTQHVAAGSKKSLQMVLCCQPANYILAYYYGYLKGDGMGKGGNIVSTSVEFFGCLKAEKMV